MTHTFIRFLFPEIWSKEYGGHPLPYSSTHRASDHPPSGDGSLKRGTSTVVASALAPGPRKACRAIA